MTSAGYVDWWGGSSGIIAFGWVAFYMPGGLGADANSLCIKGVDKPTQRERTPE